MTLPQSRAREAALPLDATPMRPRPAFTAEQLAGVFVWRWRWQEMTFEMLSLLRPNLAFLERLADKPLPKPNGLVLRIRR